MIDNINIDNINTSTVWGDLLLNYSMEMLDEELKERLEKKINEILNEDDTIKIMKKYLLRFIEENIDNPENLIKDFLISRDKELNKYKEELNECKEEIKKLRTIINPYNPCINPINPYIDHSTYPTLPNITWSTNNATTGLC